MTTQMQELIWQIVTVVMVAVPAMVWVAVGGWLDQRYPRGRR